MNIHPFPHLENKERVEGSYGAFTLDVKLVFKKTLIDVASLVAPDVK
jgi:hypothetical protein